MTKIIFPPITDEPIVINGVYIPSIEKYVEIDELKISDKAKPVLAPNGLQVDNSEIEQAEKALAEFKNGVE